MSETLTADELARLLAGSDPPTVLDIRRRADRDASPHAFPGAEWRDPERVAEWAGELEGPVVLHCVRGGSVSRSVHAALAERGIQAKFLAGGLDAWRDAGHPLIERGPASGA